MEQKMLLPIVIVVLVGGFLIGYYAKTLSLSEKGSEISPSIQSNELFVDPASDFVVKSGFFEDFVGTVKSVDSSGWVLTSGGKDLKLSPRTAFFRPVTIQKADVNPTATGQKPASYLLPMSLPEVKVGDTFKATVRYDAKEGKLIGVIAVKNG